MNRIAAVVAGLSLAFVGTSATFAGTINVPGDYETIQGAVDAANNGDEIVVAPGTYTSTHPAHVVDMKGKAITLHASGTPEETVIDGENARRGVACVSGETELTVIEGFTITNGYGVRYDFDGDGSNDWWEDDGGGIFCKGNSSPTITDCTISGNTANNNGGGIYCLDNCSPTITNCSITGNSTIFGQTTHGGGISCINNSNPTITGCTITGNSTNSASGSGGGGIYFAYSPNSILSDTMVCGNAPDQIYGSWIATMAAPSTASWQIAAAVI